LATNAFPMHFSNKPSLGTHSVRGLEQFPNRCTPWIRGFSRKPPKGSTPERRKLKGNPL
jgi:hypothetical protein